MSATKPKALIRRLPGWVEAMNAALRERRSGR